MLQKIFQKVVRVFCCVFVGYIFLQGLFTLCNIQRIEERTFFISNKSWTQLLGIALFTLLTYFITRPVIWSKLEKYGHILFWTALGGMTIFLIWWVSQTSFWYYGDAEKMFACSAGLNVGYYEEWLPGGYAHMWPFQNTYILFISFLNRFFPPLELFNVFYYISIGAYFMTVASIYKMFHLLIKEKAVVYIQGIMMALYLPFAFMTMCMYGDSIGYGFAALAMYLAVKYTKTEKLYQLLLSGCALFVGICFKQNTMILFVGILAILFLHAVSAKKEFLRRSLLVAAFVVIVLVGISLPNRIIHAITGIDDFEGNSKWAHLAMGLQEGDKGPGWYNSYNHDIFVENGYDNEKTGQASLESIRTSLDYFAENPDYAWRFFNLKLASEWNNPTFECFHNQNSRTTVLELSSFVKSTINDGGKINILLIWILDIGQSILLFGVLLYFLHDDRTDYRQLLPGLLFIGAFIFWMFWEAKSRYVVPYLFFLIPYSFMGYQMLVQKWKEKKLIIKLASLAVMIVFLQFSNAQWVTNSFRINQDTEEYYEYIHMYNKNFMNLRY